MVISILIYFRPFLVQTLYFIGFFDLFWFECYWLYQLYPLMWISLTIIFLPVLILIFLKSADFDELLDFSKLSKITASISLVGMFLLFMTQWTKDDGDEMYLQMRLTAVLLGVITGITTLLVSSIFSLINWLDFDYTHYNGFGLMFFILLMILSNFGQQIYSLSKQREE